MTSTTPIAVSFSYLLNALHCGDIKADELEGALFYFGCTRAHVFDNGVGGEEGEMQYAIKKDPEGVEAVYQVVLAAVTAAELDGRVAWRELHELPNWGQLNGLLEKNNLPMISFDGVTERCLMTNSGVYPSSYSYPGVAEAVRKQQLPYHIICGWS